MKKFLVLVLIAVFALAGTSRALNFKPTPVQDAFRQTLFALNSGSDNPFGEKPEDTSKGKATTSLKRPIEGQKSVWKAALLSGLVPGGGEYYLGQKSKARFFFAAEAASWIGFASFRVWGHWKKQDYIRYADQYAGAHLEGKSDQFNDFVGFYSDITAYNTLGRVSDPERPYLADTPDNHWRWQSTAEQQNYRTIKNQSREAYRRANFMIGLAVVARVVSIVDAVLATHRINSKAETSFSQADRSPVELRLDPLAPTGQVALVLHTGW